MNKKPILSKHPKKLIVFLLVCLITITLAGCDSSNKTPTGDFDLTAKYASVGNYEVTVGDVYNKLRYNAVSYVENQVYNFLYKEEIEEVKADLSENGEAAYKEKIEEKILDEIYGVHEEDELEDLTDKQKDIAVKKYVDNMYKKGYVISAEEVVAKKFSSVYPNYYLEIAKYIAAKNKLEGEFEKNEDGSIKFGEINDESYFTEDEVIEWYETNYENTGDVTAILVRFINEAEIDEIFKKFGLKQANNKWYQIKLDTEKCSTKNGYDKYYEDYKIDLKGDSPLTSVDKAGNGRATILKIYAAIYNYVYVYRNPINLTSEVINDSDNHLKYFNYIKSIIENDSLTYRTNPDNTEYEELVEKLVQYNEANEETTVLTKERLDKYSTSLRSYVYGLKTEAEEEGKSFTQYSTKGQSKGEYYYLVFKAKHDEVTDEKDTPLYEEVKNENDEVEIKFTNETFLNKILLEMFEDEINATYINEAFDERVKEAELKIYDSIVESQFMYNSTSTLAKSYEKNKKENNNVVAEVTYKGNTHQITVKDTYEYLEPLNGPQLASNLLFQEYIKTTDYYKDLEADYDDYVETVKLMLYYFSNDYYAGSGYPSSIGKYNFMMLYYGTANVDEVVKNSLMVSDATNAYFSDVTKHGFANSDDFYNKFVTYAEKTYEDFYSLTASGLTVYVDKDEDGVADDIASVENEAKALLEVALQEVKNSNVDYSTAFNNIVSDFNSSSRIEDDNPTTPESKWAQYRKLGLHIKVSSYSTITNTTEGVDEKIIDRIEALYPVVVDKVLGFTSNILDEEIITTEDNEVTTLLITGGAKPTSAVFKTEDEELKALYDSVKVVINDKKETIELEYDEDMVNVNQVKVYVAEYLLLGDVYSLPATTTAALDAYVLPLITKYTGNASQQLIVSKELGEITFHYSGKLSADFNEGFVTDYNTKGRTGFLQYYNTILQNSEDGYDPQYANWWTEMYQG